MPDVAAFVRLLQTLWLAVCAAAVLLMAVLGWLAVTNEPPMADLRDGVFYGVALLSLGATAGAFALVRAMEGRLLQAGSDAEAMQAVQSLGLAALATAEVSALLGAIGAFLTGELLTLAFGATLFAFAGLTWPSSERVAHWLSLRHRG